MKLYDCGLAPNPRRVRVYLAEKGIAVPREQVDLGGMQQKSAAYTAINPLQRVPALALDDGTVIAESIAICRYGGGRDVESPNRTLPIFSGGPGFSSPAPCHEGNGSAPGRFLGRGQQASGDGVPANSRTPTSNRPIHLRRTLLGRRYNGPRRHRLHETRKACGAAGVHQHCKMACESLRAAQRRGINFGANGATVWSDCGFHNLALPRHPGARVSRPVRRENSPASKRKSGRDA